MTGDRKLTPDVWRSSDDDDELQAKHLSLSGAINVLSVSLPVAQNLTVVPKVSIGSRADSLPADVTRVDCPDLDE